MDAIAINPFLTQDTHADILSQQLRSYAWKNFRYALTQCDVEEILFTEMWNSLEDFIGYMKQDGVVLGDPIPGTMNYIPPPITQFYTMGELDAIDAGILPINYGISGSYAPSIEMQPGGDSEDRDSVSIFTDYDGEPLPLYTEDKPPSYPSLPPPLSEPPPYRSHFNECFDVDDVRLIHAAAETPKYLEEDAPEVSIGVPKPEGEDKPRRFPDIRPRFATRLQSLKHKFPSRKKQPTTKDNLTGAPQECAPKPIRKTRGLAKRLERLVSPKRVARGATRLITLIGQSRMAPFY
ncbi:hypothetical protein GGR51DRAFT_574818 [Nemania sp. FL0031]|nr:hypothetical protein GGR51DRAFT_574818 [Nemania sp. FL0031]